MAPWSLKNIFEEFNENFEMTLDAVIYFKKAYPRVFGDIVAGVAANDPSSYGAATEKTHA
jgi:hypothetical protein